MVEVGAIAQEQVALHALTGFSFDVVEVAQPPEVAPPDVSVIIPAYNAERTLIMAVATALDQVGIMVEVVVCDDASTDGTWVICQQMVRDCANVRAVRRRMNCGVAAAQNNAAEQATGRYFIVLGADDEYRQDMLPKMVEALDTHDDVGFVYGDSETFGASKKKHLAPGVFRVEDYYRYFPTWYGYMFRREAFDQGLRWTDFIRREGRWLGLQDWDMALQLIEVAGYVGRKIEGTVLRYRATHDGMDGVCRKYWGELMGVLKERHPQIKGSY